MVFLSCLHLEGGGGGKLCGMENGGNDHDKIYIFFRNVLIYYVVLLLQYVYPSLCEGGPIFMALDRR
jgi:hypothetical protein